MSDHHGKIHWSELVADDARAAMAYYQKTCGWTFETMDMPAGPYHVASRDGAAIAGIMEPTPEMTHGPAWVTYVAVDDVDAAARAAPTLHHGPEDVPGVGRIAMVTDGGGALVGLITPAAG